MGDDVMRTAALAAVGVVLGLLITDAFAISGLGEPLVLGGVVAIVWTVANHLENTAMT